MAVDEGETKPVDGIWTRPVAVVFLLSAGAIPFLCLVAVVGGPVGSAAVALGLLAFFNVLIVDMIVCRRASPGVPWFIKMADGSAIHRRAYRWSLIRAALDEGARQRS